MKKLVFAVLIVLISAGVAFAGAQKNYTDVICDSSTGVIYEVLRGHDGVNWEDTINPPHEVCVQIYQNKQNRDILNSLLNDHSAYVAGGGLLFEGTTVGVGTVPIATTVDQDNWKNKLEACITDMNDIQAAPAWVNLSNNKKDLIIKGIALCIERAFKGHRDEF